MPLIILMMTVAIDVVWTISTVDDFSHYIVWVADQPVTDLSSAWAAFGDDPDKMRMSHD